MGFLENYDEKNYDEKLDSVKNCFHIFPWMNVKDLKMGTSSKAQFTLTVRTVSVYIAKTKANVLMGIWFIFCARGLKHH